MGLHANTITTGEQSRVFPSGHKIDLQRIWKDNASLLSQDLNLIKHHRGKHERIKITLSFACANNKNRNKERSSQENFLLS